jgi:hypothetical protein
MGQDLRVARQISTLHMTPVSRALFPQHTPSEQITNGDYFSSFPLTGCPRPDSQLKTPQGETEPLPKTR